MLLVVKRNFLIALSFMLLTLLGFSTGISAVTGEETDCVKLDFSLLASETTSMRDMGTNQDSRLVVVLDPGHYSNYNVVTSNTNDSEAAMNLKVATACKNYLETYYGDKVVVYMTRTETLTSDISLPDRASIATSYGADIMISFHFNATTSHTAVGCEVYTSALEEYALTNLATKICTNLGNLGISNRGVRTRLSGTNTTWVDGTRIADYYGIIKHPATHEIPSIIIEHCFYDSSDYTNYANTDAKLINLGAADAKAIAEQYNLGESVSDSDLESYRSSALNQLNSGYQGLTLSKYTTTIKNRIQAIYNDAKTRINAANGTGKINQTLNRAVKTFKNYPVSDSDTPVVGNFTDVKESDWFCTAVAYCYEKNYFSGISDTIFGPNQAMTRGMFVTVLGRMAGVNSATPAETGFDDVDSNAYYAPYILWAKSKNIVSGVGNNKFLPDKAITRQEIAKILYGYYSSNGISTTDNGRCIDDFNDSSSVSQWAVESMNWAVSSGFLNGDDKDNLNPLKNATRAEVAQIIYNLQ